jgi:hypothetical protein
MTSVQYPNAVRLSRAGDLFVAMALVTGAFMVGLEVCYLLAAKLPYGPLGHLVGHDFVNTWMGARIALTGDPTPWFDFDTYNAALKSMLGPDYPDLIWSYPPHLLLFTWPFGLIPYLPSYALWVICGLLAYLAAATGGAERMRTILLLIVSPAAVLTIFAGQNGFFTAALLIGGLTMLDRRPWLAGVLFGILTVKPQLGVLLPIMLILTGRWRTIAAAVATTGVLVGLAALVFGPGVWIAYRDVAMPHQTHVFLHGTGLFIAMMPTAFMNARVAGIPLDIGWVAQAVMSLTAIAAVVWTYWKPRDPLLSLALLITATFVATPYVFNYDMVVFGWLFARLIERPDNKPLDYWLMAAVWTLPMTTIMLGLLAIPGSVLALVAFGIGLLWQMHRESRSVAGGVPAVSTSLANS